VQQRQYSEVEHPSATFILAGNVCDIYPCQQCLRHFHQNCRSIILFLDYFMALFQIHGLQAISSDDLEDDDDDEYA
jgi:hypothetical protein